MTQSKAHPGPVPVPSPASSGGTGKGAPPPASHAEPQRRGLASAPEAQDWGETVAFEALDSSCASGSAVSTAGGSRKDVPQPPVSSQLGVDFETLDSRQLAPSSPAGAGPKSQGARGAGPASTELTGPATERVGGNGPFSRLRSDPPPDADGIRAEHLNIVFQPIFSTATRKPFAYEALTRCHWPNLTNPETLFRMASEEQACGRLGRLIRESALQRAPDFPLFVNVHPDELAARWLVRPDDPLFYHPQPVYVEITESAAFTHYELCVSVLREIRSRSGIFLAVDDLGAGHSNLKRVIDLEPHVVKLDRALITALDRSHRQQILVRNVVRLCEELGAQVVAEGIETRDELRAVIDAGAHYAQGYVLGRPMYPPPPPHWPEEMPARPASSSRTRRPA